MMKTVLLYVILVLCLCEDVEDPEWKRVSYSYRDDCNTCYSTCLERTFKDGKIERKYDNQMASCTMSMCFHESPVVSYKNREELENIK